MASLQLGLHTGGSGGWRRLHASGEAAAKETEVHVEEEEKRGAAEGCRSEVVRVRPAELLPELRRRPRLHRPPPLVAGGDPSAA